MSAKRIFLCSNDTVGLGHFSRSLKIANYLSKNGHEVSLACSEPVALAMRERVDVGVKLVLLPGLKKVGNLEYQPIEKTQKLAYVKKARGELLLRAVKHFGPQIFISDKTPLGPIGELKDVLEYLAPKNCQTICGFRDILDDPNQVAKEWRINKTQSALVKYYDRVFVYGDPLVFDFVRAYKVCRDVKESILYTGYVSEERGLTRERSCLSNRKPCLLVATGGGEDSKSFLEKTSGALLGGAASLFSKISIMPGPFFDRNYWSKLLEKTEQISNAEILDGEHRFDDQVSDHDILLTMGGYNTLCEAISNGRRPLVIPRISPRSEQLIRAREFKALGYCDYIEPSKLTEDVLGEKLVCHQGKIPQTSRPLNLTALERINTYVSAHRI